MKQGFKQFLGIFTLIATLNPLLGWADTPEFTSRKVDLNVPAKCLPLGIQNFAVLPRSGEALEKVRITVSLIGAHDKGFTHELALRRDYASQIWSVMKSYRSQFSGKLSSLRALYEKPSDLAALESAQNELKKDLLSLLEAQVTREEAKELTPYLEKIASRFVLSDTSFTNEGDVLELLWPESLSKTSEPLKTIYPETEYFYTGGLEYRHAGGRTLGELDILIGRRSDCQIIAFGEAKLGIKSLAKARSQLARFIAFLDSYADLLKVPPQKGPSHLLPSKRCRRYIPWSKPLMCESTLFGWPMRSFTHAY